MVGRFLLVIALSFALIIAVFIAGLETGAALF